MAHLNAFQTLDDLLDAVVLENLCTQMNCSTCGAGPFRQKIAAFLAHRMRMQRVHFAGNTADDRLSPAQVRVLAQELQTIGNGIVCAARPMLRSARSGAVGFLIRLVWNHCPEEGQEEWVRSALGDTQAGALYEVMLTHYKADHKRWAALEANNSPEVIERRKLEKARVRDEQLLQRALRKAEIDRLWREKRPKSEHLD